MRWFRKHLWNIGMAIIGTLLLLPSLNLSPLLAANAQEKISKGATPTTVTVQATPTEDATVTELNKEQLTQQVAGQQHTLDNWAWSNLTTILSSLLSTLVVIIGILVGFRQWRVGRADTQKKELEDKQATQDKDLEDHKAEREKRAEERFQAAVTGLGDPKEGARIGAAILLRTFLRPGYEPFYMQVFDLAVANLRLPRTAFVPEEDPDALHTPTQVDPKTPLPLTTLSRALITVFRESFPLARDTSRSNGNKKNALQSLDATGIQLDHAYLSEVDLDYVWMPWAFLREADLESAHLNGAHLAGTNLTKAYLAEAHLNGANLFRAKLEKAYLRNAHLAGADLSEADLSDADLRQADLSDADLRESNLSGADLEWAKLNGTYLSRARLQKADLSGAYLSGAKLEKAYLRYANLSGADLRFTNLFGAFLSGANLNGTDLSRTSLPGADLAGADLSGANLNGTNLSKANLLEANLTRAKLNGANLTRADLTGADLSEADLRYANLSGTTIEKAKSLQGTNLSGAQSLTKEQVEVCKTRGAIYKFSTTHVSQLPAAFPSVQNDDTQAFSDPRTQANTPSPNPNTGDTTLSRQEPKL